MQAKIFFSKNLLKDLQDKPVGLPHKEPLKDARIDGWERIYCRAKRGKNCYLMLACEQNNEAVRKAHMCALTIINGLICH